MDPAELGRDDDEDVGGGQKSSVCGPGRSGHQGKRNADVVDPLVELLAGADAEASDETDPDAHETDDWGEPKGIQDSNS